MTFAAHWSKLFCKNQFDFFALVKSPRFFLQMITLETSTLFFPQMLVREVFLQLAKLRGCPRVVFYYTTLWCGAHSGCLPSSLFWRTVAASVGGQLLASSRTVFPADRRPNPTTEGAGEGAAHYPRSARAAMLVQCTGAAPALQCTAMKPWPNLPSPAQETQKI